jgi:hypothetical protein
VTGLALNTYLRFRSLEQRLTQLARDMALRSAHRPEDEATAPAAPAADAAPSSADDDASADRAPALVPSEGNATGDHR